MAGCAATIAATMQRTFSLALCHAHRHLLQPHHRPRFSPSSSFPILPVPCATSFHLFPRQSLNSNRCHATDAKHLCDYGEPFFWDRTYSEETEPLEWYQSYSDMAPLIRKYIPTSSRVLMAGCGNAEMSEDMVKDGFEDILNIDNSSVVIEMMQKKYQNIRQLKYMKMDVLNLTFDDASFDSVIDKGTLDAIMCVAGGPYSIPIMISEMYRILKPGGTYMLITTGDPKSRLPLLKPDVFQWNITLYIIPKPGSEISLKGCPKAYCDPVPFSVDGAYTTEHVIEKADQLFVFICIKPE